MTDYKFTQDWFSHNIPVWEQLATLLPEHKSFLEIGSFEGRSAVWIIENMMNPGDWIDCVDTWEGSEEHKNGELSGAEERFDHNIIAALNCNSALHRSREGSWGHTRFASNGPDRTNNRVYKYKSTSTRFLGEKLCDVMFSVNPLYDFIYIDGSHIAKDVLTDACMAWPLLKQGGIMVFDDYMWGNPRDILHRPKPAIDTFINMFAEEVDVVHIGYQAVVRKK